MAAPSGGPARSGRLHPADLRGHDPKAGTGRVLINDDPAELPVGMSVEPGAIVHLLEEGGTGKLMVSTATKPSAHGWSAVATRHS